LTQEQINRLIQKYKKVSNEISLQYHYPKNIEHLLSLILPAFVMKYGISHEALILDCFWNVPILIHEKEDAIATALYSTYLEGDTVKRFIVLNHYNSSSFLEHFDNLIHEYNHAINSYKKILTKTEQGMLVRSGLSYVLYQTNGKVQRHIALEEIINTKQTEEIINILAQFGKDTIDSYEIKTALYSLQQELQGNHYQSFAYSSLAVVTKNLVENKTFFKTVEQLRLEGNLDMIPSWFDHMTKESSSYERLNQLLDSFLMDLKSIRGKKVSIFLKSKLKKKIDEIEKIIHLFHENCLYK